MGGHSLGPLTIRSLTELDLRGNDERAASDAVERKPMVSGFKALGRRDLYDQVNEAN